jgi:DNA-directed RNA polymerase subunit H
MPEEFDIRNNVLVPKHEVLPKEEAEALLRNFKITPYQLPLIKSSDPVVKALGANPGDIIKITRKSPTAGKAVVYRYVVGK